MIHKELFHANMEDLLNHVRRQKQTDDSNPEVYRERIMSVARRALKETKQDEISIEHKKGKVSFRLDRDTDKIRMVLNGQEVPDDQLADVIANLDEIGKTKTAVEKAFTAVSESGLTREMGSKVLHHALHSTHAYMQETAKTANSLLGALLQIVGRSIAPR